MTIGLFLGFLHFHATVPLCLAAPCSRGCSLFSLWLCPKSFSFVAGCRTSWSGGSERPGALLITSALFGLSHFNKRTTLFNWRYVLLAALAGIFYGLAWRQERRVGASAITHASVDTIWGIWLR